MMSVSLNAGIGQETIGAMLEIERGQDAPAIELRAAKIEATAALLTRVCEAHGLKHAEVLRPSTSGMVLCAASYCRDAEVEEYHEESNSFTFPSQVGIPGRVWMKSQVEWHADVTELPAHQFLRLSLAKRAGLRGAVGIPFTMEEDSSDASGSEDGEVAHEVPRVRRFSVEGFKRTASMDGKVEVNANALKRCSSSEGSASFFVLVFYSDRRLTADDAASIVSAVQEHSLVVVDNGLRSAERPHDGGAEPGIETGFNGHSALADDDADEGLFDLEIASSPAVETATAAPKPRQHEAEVQGGAGAGGEQASEPRRRQPRRRSSVTFAETVHIASPSEQVEDADASARPGPNEPIEDDALLGPGRSGQQQVVRAGVRMGVQGQILGLATKTEYNGCLVRVEHVRDDGKVVVRTEHGAHLAVGAERLVLAGDEGTVVAYEEQPEYIGVAVLVEELRGEGRVQVRLLSNAAVLVLAADRLLFAFQTPTTPTWSAGGVSRRRRQPTWKVKEFASAEEAGPRSCERRIERSRHCLASGGAEVRSHHNLSALAAESEKTESAPRTSSSAELEEDVADVLRVVCEEQGLLYGEAFRGSPSDGEMKLCSAHYSQGPLQEAFHAASFAFKFDGQKGIPGRVFSRRRMEWHSDVLALSSHKFLRRMHAIPAGLRGAVAMPFTLGHSFYVLCFFGGKSMHNDQVYAILGLASGILQRLRILRHPKRLAVQTKLSSGEAETATMTKSMSVAALPSSSSFGSMQGLVRSTSMHGLVRSTSMRSYSSSEEPRLSSTESVEWLERSGSMDSCASGAASSAGSDTAWKPRALNTRVEEHQVDAERIIGSSHHCELFRALFEGEVVAQKCVKSGAEVDWQAMGEAGAGHARQDEEEEAGAREPATWRGGEGRGRGGQFRGVEATARLMVREAAVLEELAHPHVVQVIGVGLEGAAQSFVLFELCGGGDLESYMWEQKQLNGAGWRLRLRQVLDWAGGLAQALAHLHAHGMVHRDVRPKKLLLAGNARVLKLGGAKTMLSEGGGTGAVKALVAERFAGREAAVGAEDGPAVAVTRYTAPEVWDGSMPCSWCGDVYGGAMSVWFMCAGEAPLADDVSDEEARGGAIHERGLRPDTSAVWRAIGSVLAKAWVADPLARPTAAEMREALGAVKARDPVPVASDQGVD